MTRRAGAVKGTGFWKSTWVAAACSAVLALACAPSGWAATDSFKPLTHKGESMPSFTVQELSGHTFSMARERGKVVVVNFWATWCSPCRVEMPLLEKEIWDQYKSNPDFAMVAIARQQTEATIASFSKMHPEFTYPLAYDPERKVYAKFADAGIPRSYVVDKHGKIVFQSVGYETGDIKKLNKAVQKALAGK